MSAEALGAQLKVHPNILVASNQTYSLRDQIHVAISIDSEVILSALYIHWPRVKGLQVI